MMIAIVMNDREMDRTRQEKKEQSGTRITRI